MKKRIQYFTSIALTLIVLLLASCKGEEFRIEGNIKQAKDLLLYFEHNSLTGFQVIDSVKLDESGAFAFSGARVDNPEFYRLRIAGEIINIAIDSTEQVNITATYPQMASVYDVRGSYENEKIKELALKQIDLQTKCQAAFTQQGLAADSLIETMIAQYKEEVKRDYIFKEPMRAYSYFALFQYIVVGNNARLLFDPTRNSADNKVFGAVATSWDTFYPNSERGKNLHNITIKGMNDQRIVDAQQKAVEVKAEETGLIDVVLRDNHGAERSLKQLKGKVVLLNFHAFALKGSTEYIMGMREFYNKYHDKGLEIYMVSLDDNAHFWKEQVANLPWINVYDDRGASRIYTDAATATPIIYLIDRENNVVKNPAQLKNLESEVAALLAK